MLSVTAKTNWSILIHEYVPGFYQFNLSVSIFSQNMLCSLFYSDMANFLFIQEVMPLF